LADTSEVTATVATTAPDFSIAATGARLLNSAQINTVGPAALTGQLQPGLLTPAQTSVQSELEMKALYKNWHNHGYPAHRKIRQQQRPQYRLAQ